MRVTCVALSAILVLAACSSRGSAWTEASANPHAVLADGVLLVRYIQAEYAPAPEEYAVRTETEERDLVVLDDLREHLVPIDSPDRATQYLDLVRFLALDGGPPGIGHATPNRGGVSPLFDQQVAERWGLRRTVVAVDGGFQVDEPAVVSWTDLRLVELRVRVMRDGAITWEERREVARGAEVNALLFRAR